MIRNIIDVPLLFMRALDVNWRPDWRGQPPWQGVDGSEQVVLNRFPRWIGSPSLLLPPEMVGAWRAIVLQAEGRVNAYRIRMVDPLLQPDIRGGDWWSNWQAYQAGLYSEPRPQILCPDGAAVGATSIVIDERGAPEPVRVGAYLSHADWPFAVTGRSGSGAEVTLTVKLLRKAIPEGAAIDLLARGVFLGTSDAMGFPAYDLVGVAQPQLDLIEWINRS